MIEEWHSKWLGELELKCPGEFHLAMENHHLKWINHQWEIFRILKWRYLPYIRPIVQAYFLVNITRKYGQTYGTNVPPCIGSWRSAIEILLSILYHIILLYPTKLLVKLPIFVGCYSIISIINKAFPMAITRSFESMRLCRDPFWDPFWRQPLGRTHSCTCMYQIYIHISWSCVYK